MKNELVSKLRENFNRIWRCADSNKWHILREHDLLTFDWLDNSVDYRTINIKDLKSGKRAIDPWVNKMKIGDLVFVMGKNHYHGICIVNSEYKYQKNELDMGNNGIKPSVEVSYIHKLQEPVKHDLQTHNNPTTFAKIDGYKFGLEPTIDFLKKYVPEAFKALNDLTGNRNKISSNRPNHSKLNKSIPLNQIFCGPPGTGKTYKTIAKAISIVHPEFYKKNNDNRAKLTSKFKELTINNWSDIKGQIAFCTFHQSFTYEDFVEGIKPKVINEKDIIYEVEKGIFKSLCDRARTATDNDSDFDTIINKFQNKILEEGEITLYTDRGKAFDVNYTGQTTFRIRPHEFTVQDPQYPASIENIRMLYQGVPLTDIYNPSYTKGILEHLYDHYKLPKYEEVKDNDKPYVIVIDEINRGNVAAIFGELITLIEPDKRSGEDEELSVILPYSKKEFTVPKNVYIIATMNTADRSIEALDSALRRRFEFTEMLPQYNVIDEVLENMQYNNFKLSDILRTINERITILINRDHQIGHSYFLKLKGTNDLERELKKVFLNKIIPLLQEYFFNDYIKIAMVLGEGFLDSDKYSKVQFAKNVGDYDSDYDNAVVYEIKDENDIDLDESIKMLMGVEENEG